MLNKVEAQSEQRKVIPNWLLEMKLQDCVEGDEEFEEYKKALKQYENTDEGAEYVTEWTYSQDESTGPEEIARVYGQLCVELKHLYVAITRPKKRLFIYDADQEARKPIESIWREVDAI